LVRALSCDDVAEAPGEGGKELTKRGGRKVGAKALRDPVRALDGEARDAPLRLHLLLHDPSDVAEECLAVDAVEDLGQRGFVRLGHSLHLEKKLVVAKPGGKRGQGLRGAVATARSGRDGASAGAHVEAVAHFAARRSGC